MEEEIALSKLSEVILRRSKKAFDFFRDNPDKSLEIVVRFWEGILEKSSISFLESYGFVGFGIEFYSHLTYRGTINKSELIEILTYFELPNQYEKEEWIIEVKPFDFIEHIVES